MAWIEFGAEAGRVLETVDAKALEQLIKDYGIPVDGLVVTCANGRVTLAGKTKTQGDRERAVLLVGNVAGVSGVDDRLSALTRDEETQFHALEEGDTLSTLAARCYGIMRLHEQILDANKPLVTADQELKAGHVLRVPILPNPIHRVKKGETLGTIAKFWYGDPRKHSAILFVNQKIVLDPYNLVPGTELIIPARGPAVLGSEIVQDG